MESFFLSNDGKSDQIPVTVLDENSTVDIAKTSHWDYYQTKIRDGTGTGYRPVRISDQPVDLSYFFPVFYVKIFKMFSGSY